ncbi:zinc-binding dehydrogenase [Microbaculum marinum]|uniref:Zinc-binding dehydrogenase n=1 Tax=Microbaculum marinum TaxID=1764581 RepID=A0AAW9RL24_9HYPH
MRAMVIRAHGEIDDIVFEPDWRDPEAGAGEVVLKVGACTLNYHDLFTLKGMPGIKVPMPIIMGIDVAGEIAEIGEGVEGWSVGDRVLVDPVNREEGKLLGEVVDGGLAEYVKVAAHQLLRLPDTVSFEAAAALPVAYGTAYRMMVTRGRVRSGETVFILGASGGVGTGCVQLAKLAGAHVAVAASSQEKLDLLAGLGADFGVNYADQDFMRAIVAEYGKPRFWGESGGVDVVVNFTGGDTWVPSLRCVKRGGRVLTCGATAGYDPKEDLRFIWTFEIDIVGSNGWNREELQELLHLVEAGRLTPVVGETVPLEETREAFRMLAERRIFGKVAIKP